MNIDLERSTLVPDGIYKLRITETEDRTSAAGNPYVNLTCEILDSAGKPTGNILWHTLTMTPKAKFMVGRFLDAVGAPLTGTISSRSLKNKTLWAKVGKDTYQGKSKNVIDEPLTPEQAGKDADTIHNVFTLGNEPEETAGFDGGLESWEEEDDSPASIPEEMSEDTRF